MSYIIVRTEIFDGDVRIGVLDKLGTFYNQAEVRKFESREDAEDRIEDEKCDPVYDKPFMGECTFEVKEVK